MAKLVQINTVCNTSTGHLMGMIQDAADLKGYRTLSVTGRRAPFRDRNSVRIGGPVSFWLHVFITAIFDRHGFGSCLATKKIVERLRAEDPDIIHLHNLHGYYLYLPLLFRYLKNGFRGKVFWTFHDCWPFTGHCAFYTASGCEKWKTGCGNCPNRKRYPVSLLLDASKRNYRDKKRMFLSLKDLTILVPSRWMEDQVKASFMKKYPVYVVPNGVDLSVFRPDALPEASDPFSVEAAKEGGKERNGIFRKYGLDPAKKHIIGVASVWDERKGLADFKKLPEVLGEEYEILLVGLTPLQIKKLPEGIIGIRRTDDREELAKLYDLSDVFLNPSLEESFSLVTVEAIACGTPAVVLDTSAVAELVNEENGIVLHDHEPEDYLRAIRKLEEKKLTRNGVAKTALAYDSREYGKRVLDLYEKKAGAGKDDRKESGYGSCRERPLFSIITVCYNEEDRIGPTMDSVREQTFRDFEYLIKDGGSTDDTPARIKEGMEAFPESGGETKNPVRLVTGRDKGIYDAMNIAVKEASGQYVLFLNAGDTFADPGVLARVSSRIRSDKEKGAGIWYGDVYEIGTEAPEKEDRPALRTYGQKNARLWYYALGACLNHQAMFCSRELFDGKLFDTEYRICADREWQMYHIRHGVTALPLGFPVAKILTEGFSGSNIPLLEKETKRCVEKYCGGWYGLYRFVGFLKKNPLLHGLIRKTERLGSIR
ncbi:MAG: glycosyltransferase [Lachnospiraceae bacterium]|nr:glycosyltransferase [Lachnospiraceae bacterium]